MRSKWLIRNGLAIKPGGRFDCRDRNVTLILHALSGVAIKKLLPARQCCVLGIVLHKSSTFLQLKSAMVCLGTFENSIGRSRQPMPQCE